MAILLGAVDYVHGSYQVPIPPPLEWVELDMHPKIAEQPPIEQSGGRVIRQLYPHDDTSTVLLAFGDYGLNTGPIAVCGYDFGGDPVTLFESAPTEALYRWKNFDGKSYSPWVDPEWYYGPGGYTTDETGVWTNVEVGDMVHSFDMTKFNGHLIICGSHLTDHGADIAAACVWTETDGVWEQTYLHNGSSRAYRLIERDGQLWTRARSFDTGSVVETVASADGVTWAPAIWPGGDFSDWGDLGYIQKQHRIPKDPKITTSIVAFGYVWIGRSDGTVARALLPSPPK